MPYSLSNISLRAHRSHPIHIEFMEPYEKSNMPLMQQIRLQELDTKVASFNE